MARQTRPEDIQQTYLHVLDGGTTLPIPVLETFWQELSSGAYPQLEQGRLMSAYTFSEPWAVWERHLAGEELVMFLSGAATLLLASEHDEVIPLASTQVLLVHFPAGTARLEIIPGCDHNSVSDSAAYFSLLRAGR